MSAPQDRRHPSAIYEVARLAALLARLAYFATWADPSQDTFTLEDLIALNYFA